MSKPMVLIIEDEKPIADTIVYALKTEGFEPRWCTTGEEGLKTLGQKAVDLIVLDVGLPDINGFDLCRVIRKGSAVPIIFLTARSEEVDRIVGLEIGADDYMVKPFSPRELAARVRSVLRRAPNSAVIAPVPANAQARFIVDDNRKTISYNGESLDLSAQEFRILSTLVRNPGRVFSRKQIMDTAWDEPGFATERTVDTHIKTIRSKLDAICQENDPIVTHRGFGYSFKADA